MNRKALEAHILPDPELHLGAKTPSQPGPGIRWQEVSGARLCSSDACWPLWGAGSKVAGAGQETLLLWALTLGDKEMGMETEYWAWESGSTWQ